MNVDSLVKVLVDLKAKYPNVADENLLKMMELKIRLKELAKK